MGLYSAKNTVAGIKERRPESWESIYVVLLNLLVQHKEKTRGLKMQIGWRNNMDVIYYNFHLRSDAIPW